MPEGYNWKEITAFLMDNHAIEISGGLGPSAGKVGSVLPSCCPWLGTKPRWSCIHAPQLTGAPWLQTANTQLDASHPLQRRIAASNHTQLPRVIE